MKLRNRLKISWLNLSKNVIGDTYEKDLKIREIIASEQKNPEISDNRSSNIEAVNSPQKETKGIRGRIEDWRKNRLFKKMDKEIRELSRTSNNSTLGYFNWGISNRENAKIMAREMQAIETVLKKYEAKLSPENIEFLRINFSERVIAAGVVRQKGQRCEFSDIERFERSDNMFSTSPQTETFFPNFKKYIEGVKARNILKEPDPREDLVNKIELTLQAERMYNMQYNENYKGYLRKNNDVAKNLYLEGLENKWIEKKFTELHNDLKDEYERDPELKKKIDKLREKFEFDAQKANCRRLGVKLPDKKVSKQTPKTPNKLKFRMSSTKVGRELRNKNANKQESPKVQAQGPKPLETWENNAKTYAKSEKQKMIDEFSTKHPNQFNKAMGNMEKEQREAKEMVYEFSIRYPDQFNKAIGNMEKEQREAKEMADEFSIRYPDQFSKAMKNVKKTRNADAPER